LARCRSSPDRLAGRIGAADRGISNRIAAALDGEAVDEGRLLALDSSSSG
jgi:hypothetical protein